MLNKRIVPAAVAALMLMSGVAFAADAENGATAGDATTTQQSTGQDDALAKCQQQFGTDQEKVDQCVKDQGSAAGDDASDSQEDN